MFISDTCGFFSTKTLLLDKLIEMRTTVSVRIIVPFSHITTTSVNVSNNSILHTRISK